MGAIMLLGTMPAGLPAALAARGARIAASSEPADAVIAAAGEAGAVDHPATLVLGGDDEDAAIAWLDAGAADVVPRSASAALVAARAAALLRRARDRLVVGDLSIDLAERRVTRAGRPIPLLPREYRLLLHLARHRHRTVGRAELHAAVWGLPFDPGTNLVAVHLSRLRARLDRGFDRPLLVTERGRGYRLLDAGTPPA